MSKLPSLRDRILAAKRPTRTVHVPEWGLDVAIRELSLTERSQLISFVLERERAHKAHEADQALPEAQRKNLPKVERVAHENVQLMMSMVAPETHEAIFSLNDHDAFQTLGHVTLSRLLRVFLDMNVLRDEQAADDLKKTSD